MHYWLIVLALLIPAALAGDKFALLIGNGKYTHCSDLDNPANDINLLSARLKSGDYKTTLVKDASRVEMAKQLSRFCEAAKGAKQVIFFYAGHGIEVEGKNYLVPTSAKLEKKGDQKWEAIGLSHVIKQLNEANITVKMIILDCCRDDPFGATRSWRKTRTVGAKGGMAEVNDKELSQGSIIVFSGKPGQTVPDGPKGGNSPFTTALNKELLRATGKSIMDVFSDLGDFLPEANKHWVKIDSDGGSLAVLNRTPMLSEAAVAVAVPVPIKPDTKPNTKPEATPEKVVVVKPSRPSPQPRSFVPHGQEAWISFYPGKLEGDDVYFALSWQEKNAFSGYCFTHVGNSILYVTGTQPKDGEMNLSIWRGDKKIRVATLSKDLDTEDISWTGKTNIGSIHFSRERLKDKPATRDSNYKGVLGSESATAHFKWHTHYLLNGTVTTPRHGNLTVRANNTIAGTIFANLYTEKKKFFGTVLLKKSNNNGIVWNGKCHLADGTSKILSIRK